MSDRDEPVPQPEHQTTPILDTTDEGAAADAGSDWNLTASDAETGDDREDADRHAAIRALAHSHWQNEGQPEGREHDHWTRAEREFEESRRDA